MAHKQLLALIDDLNAQGMYGYLHEHPGMTRVECMKHPPDANGIYRGVCFWMAVVGGHAFIGSFLYRQWLIPDHVNLIDLAVSWFQSDADCGEPNAETIKTFGLEEYSDEEFQAIDDVVS
ncbi:MAG: hypothetical protein WEB58_07580 [Planctomycetaceae bacterium]